MGRPLDIRQYPAGAYGQQPDLGDPGSIRNFAALVLGLRQGHHARVVGDHAAIDITIDRWEVGRRRAGIKRHIGQTLFAIAVGTGKVVKKLGFPGSLFGRCGFVIEIESGDEHALVQVLQTRVRKNFSQFATQMFGRIIRADHSSEIAHIVEQVVFEDDRTQRVIQLDELRRLHTVRQRQRQDATGRCAGDHVHLANPTRVPAVELIHQHGAEQAADAAAIQREYPVYRHRSLHVDYGHGGLYRKHRPDWRSRSCSSIFSLKCSGRRFRS